MIILSEQTHDEEIFETLEQKVGLILRKLNCTANVLSGAKISDGIIWQK